MREKHSMNYFDVEKEFFLIDSDNLRDIETRLYGYSVQESGIYENDNLTETAVLGLDGCGAYVYVEVKDGKIAIQQDFNGSYGIYLFRKDGYFALSNSFLRLLEYVKTRFPVSLNRDYANHFLLEVLVNSVAYSDTLIQEITTLDKDALIEIDIQDKTLEFHLLDYEESSEWINSEKGLAILDRWFLKWTSIFRKLKNKTNQIMIDLSGGYDSRVIFLLMLQSGINLGEIYVRSINDTLHTHKEDYEIASEIAERYGFELNNKKIIKNAALPYSMEDILNISFYTKLGFHKEMYFRHSRNEWKRYRITGKGGETVRAYWNMTAEQFKDKMCAPARQYSQNILGDMVESTHRLINFSYKAMKEKHQIVDDNSKDYPIYMYREIRNRGHFGKWSVENYFSNNYDLSPFMDPLLLKLRLNDPQCQDNNLLMAMIFVRYCPLLLEFKFDGGRIIDFSTIEFAHKINERFEGRFGTAEESRTFHVNVRDMQISRLKDNTDNPFIPSGTPEKYLKSVFDSTGFRKLFATCFDEEIYHKANLFFEKNSYYPLRHCYSIIAIVKAIEDVTASQDSIFPAPVQSMERFIHKNYYEADDGKDIIERYKDYITARIDFKFSGAGNLEPGIVSVSDERAVITKPQWFQEDGIGYVVESYEGKLDISFRPDSDCALKVWERGRDVRDGAGNRIPYWIEYQNVECNGNVMLEAQGTVTHDNPICLDYLARGGVVISFHIEWSPYRGDYKDLEKIKSQANIIESLHKEIVDKEREIKDKRAEIKNKEKEIRDKESDIRSKGRELRNKEKEISDIKNSRTYRVGCILMYIPKKIKNGLSTTRNKAIRMLKKIFATR